jgi:hypothetical protein
MIYLRLQTCWNGFISIWNMLVDIATNMNTCSMLLGWDLWNHMVNNWRFFLYTMSFWHLISTQCATSMFGAFTSSILTCCSCCPSYTYAISVISWCMTYSNHLNLFFITTIYYWSNWSPLQIGHPSFKKLRLASTFPLILHDITKTTI